MTLWIAWLANNDNHVSASLKNLVVKCFVLSSDIEECLTDPCLNGGMCMETPGNYTCFCVPQWEGTHCENGKDTDGFYLVLEFSHFS